MPNVHRDLGQGAWVEFQESGYPFKLRREIKAAPDDEAALAIIARYVTACHLPVIGAEPLKGFTSHEELEKVDEAVVGNLIMAFYDFRNERVREPLSKNT